MFSYLQKKGTEGENKEGGTRAAAPGYRFFVQEI
jgi:hypothetical protein